MTIVGKANNQIRLGVEDADCESVVISGVITGSGVGSEMILGKSKMTRAGSWSVDLKGVVVSSARASG